MKIAYCTNVRLPSERAHSHQVAAVCQALVHIGHEVTLFAPFRSNVVLADFWAYHDVSRSVRLQYVGTFDPIASPFLPGIFGLWWMNWMLRRSLPALLQSGGFDIVYTRSPALLSGLLHCNIPVVLELHQLPRFGRALFVRRARRCARVVCLTSAMATTLKAWGVPSEIVTVEGDAVDLARFQSLPGTSDARSRFGLRTERRVIGYVGRLKTLGMEKGIETILRAVAEDRRYFAFIVGGPAIDRAFYEDRARDLGLTREDVLFTGEIPAVDVPKALVAADVLAMPFPDRPHYRCNMSPLKMFEYMASGIPCITSDLPTIRDVLSEEEAFFCAPGDTTSFLQSLETVFGSLSEAKKRAENARRLVENYTWEKRMDRILKPLS